MICVSRSSVVNRLSWRWRDPLATSPPYYTATSPTLGSEAPELGSTVLLKSNLWTRLSSSGSAPINPLFSMEPLNFPWVE